MEQSSVPQMLWLGLMYLRMFHTPWVATATRCMLCRMHVWLRTSVLVCALVRVCSLQRACYTLAPSLSLIANNMPCPFVTDASDGGPVNIMETRSRRRMLAHTWSAKCCALSSESHPWFIWVAWGWVECGRVIGWKVGKWVVVENRGRRRNVEKSRKEEEGDRGVEL